MTAWKRTFREGFAPSFSTKGLEALAEALRADDPHLMQGGTTDPPPLMCVQDFPCECACPVAFVGWKGEELETVGEVEEFFAKACFEADQRLGEPAACRYLLNWVDDSSRDVLRKELLAEVEVVLAERKRGEL